MEKDKLLGEYDKNLDLSKNLATSMERLINILLNDDFPALHSISARVKERSSLSKKIDKRIAKDNIYKSLKEITDIVGIRVISNYADDVDKIAEIINKEFFVDMNNSIDKRAGLESDRFGYLSLHYIVCITEERANLTEYKIFKDIKFEIQIRSILQHTWAEIEHDIGYKSESEVPQPILRKFSMLAGLLELADDQFIQIRDYLSNYKEKVNNLIKSTPEAIDINSISIYEYVNNSEIVKKIDSNIADKASFNLVNCDEFQAEFYLEFLCYFGIETIAKLEEEINENSAYIIKLAEDVNGNSDNVYNGISIFYLCKVLAAKLNDKSKILDFCNEMNLCSPYDREGYAEYLLNFSARLDL